MSNKKMTKNKQNYRNILSRFMGYLCNIKRPKFLVKFAISIFVYAYKIDMSQYEIPKGGFRTFNSFFTRHLLKNARKISDFSIISPVDGTVFDFGTIDHENKIFVKHKHYYVEDLICKGADELNSYLVLYLSPADYHRVHACFDMEINSISYIPGTLFSVKPKVVYKRDSLYCRNERIVLEGNSEFGKFSFILVGAIMVGKVKLSFGSEMRTNIKRGIFTYKKYDNPVKIKKGEEIGHFEMGSSVIILTEKNGLENLNKALHEKVKFGEALSQN